MMFGQLSNRESVSDLAFCLQSQRSKWYHPGLGKPSFKETTGVAWIDVLEDCKLMKS